MTHTTLTAWNQSLSNEENHQNMQKLRETLLAQGFHFEEIQIVWNKQVEPCCLIQDLPIEMAYQLARYFKQEAFVHQGVLIDLR